MSTATHPSIKDLAAAVERRMHFHFSNYRSAPSAGLFEAGQESEIFDEVESLTLRGGKRLRAALILIGGGLLEDGAMGSQAHLDAGAALELIQSYLLIHDDIMDDDAVRRGGPSVHVALENAGHPRDEAIGLAILAGDLAKSIAEEIVAGLETSADRLSATQKILAHMHRDVIYGQSLDIGGSAPSEVIARHKTASYTTIGPLMIGAALSGSSDATLHELYEIGLALGVAFQIKDDLLGLFGDPDQLGKPIGADLRAGKRNWIIERALEITGDDGRSAILATHGRIGSTEDSVRGTLRIIESSGAPEDARQRIDDLIEQAVGRIEQAAFNKDATALLKQLARYIGQRNS